MYKCLSFCIGITCVFQGAQFNPTIMAVALPREVIEIEIPDTAGLDTVSYERGDIAPIGPGGALPKRRFVKPVDCFNRVCVSLSPSLPPSLTPPHSQSVAFVGTGDFIMVQATPYLRSPNSTSHLPESPMYLNPGMHTQTGTQSSIVSHVTITCLSCDYHMPLM